MRDEAELRDSLRPAAGPGRPLGGPARPALLLSVRAHHLRAHHRCDFARVTSRGSQDGLCPGHKVLTLKVLFQIPALPPRDRKPGGS